MSNTDATGATVDYQVGDSRVVLTPHFVPTSQRAPIPVLADPDTAARATDGRLGVLVNGQTVSLKITAVLPGCPPSPVRSWSPTCRHDGRIGCHRAGNGGGHPGLDRGTEQSGPGAGTIPPRFAGGRCHVVAPVGRGRRDRRRPGGGQGGLLLAVSALVALALAVAAVRDRGAFRPGPGGGRPVRPRDRGAAAAPAAPHPARSSDVDPAGGRAARANRRAGGDRGGGPAAGHRSGRRDGDPPLRVVAPRWPPPA